MFEGLVSDILLRFLGKYVNGLAPENLKIGIFAGDVKLKNLEIKPEALLDVNLPFAVTFGTVGNIELTVPWKNLKSQPVIVKLRDIYILAGPASEFHYDEAAAKKKAVEEKLARLAKWESQKVKEESGSDDGLAATLVERIVANLQFSLENVHVRFEDPRGSHIYAVGVSFRHLYLKSTDANWEEKFVEDAGHVHRKKGELVNFAVYINSPTSSWKGTPRAELLKMFETYMDPTLNSCVVHPRTLSVQIVLDKLAMRNFNAPLYVVKAVFEEISVEISRHQ